MPKQQNTPPHGNVNAFIGVGSNIAPKENILKALDLLKQQVTVTGTSTFYRTKPLQDKIQPDYLNGVWKITTRRPPMELKQNVLAPIEASLERKRSEDKYASRTIDLDLLVFGDAVIKTDGLSVPDPDIYTRPFIAIPLAELDPGLILPDTGQAVLDITASFPPHSMMEEHGLSRVLKRNLLKPEYKDRDRRRKWACEYEIMQGIQLGYQQNNVPPVLREFHQLVRNSSIPAPRRILDAGCGKGRIGLHLARAGYEVIGFDFVDSAVEKFRRLAADQALENRVTVFSQDINDAWNLPDASVDCVFAVTVIEDLVREAQQHHFREECLRVLAPKGAFVLEYYTQNDGYYGRLLADSAASDNTLEDPHNTILFKIYTEREITELFRPPLQPVFKKECTWHTTKYDRPYKRNSQILVFRKT